MSITKRHLRWVAPVALAGALGLAACGDDGTPVTARTAANADVTGSDRHLDNLAADIAGRTNAGPNVFEAGNRAAEAALRSGEQA
ncbi:MAG TPA: hypothetical protein VFZ77_10815 [Acidimicrobiales bacterium]